MGPAGVKLVLSLSSIFPQVARGKAVLHRPFWSTRLLRLYGSKVWEPVHGPWACGPMGILNLLPTSI